MTAVQESRGELIPRDDAEKILAEYGSLFDRIPSPEQDGGIGMIADILNSASIDDLIGEPEKLPNAQDMVGKRLKVTGLIKLESDEAYRQQSGFPFYIVAEGIDTATGEVVRFNTGSAHVMAKLVTAFARHKVAAVVCEIKRAEKATRNGFYPLNCNILAVDRSVNAE